MKDINLMFNSANPEIHFIVSAGQSIDIKTPGVYNVVPINLEKIVAGVAKQEVVTEEPKVVDGGMSVFDMVIKESDNLIMKQSPEYNKNTDILFTQNLSKLLADSRHK